MKRCFLLTPACNMCYPQEIVFLEFMAQIQSTQPAFSHLQGLGLDNALTQANAILQHLKLEPHNSIYWTNPQYLLSQNEGLILPFILGAVLNAINYQQIIVLGQLQYNEIINNSLILPALQHLLTLPLAKNSCLLLPLSAINQQNQAIISNIKQQGVAVYGIHTLKQALTLCTQDIM
jgi:hypothetical protein